MARDVRKVSGYGWDVPIGTLMLFQQTAAPTGWVKETTHNNKALRLVTGSAGSAGTSPFTTIFGAGKVVSNTSPSTPTMAAHAHNISAGNTSNGNVDKNGGQNVETRTTITAGGGGPHNHPLPVDVQYVDLIIARKM